MSSVEEIRERLGEIVDLVAEHDQYGDEVNRENVVTRLRYVLSCYRENLRRLRESDPGGDRKTERARWRQMDGLIWQAIEALPEKPASARAILDVAHRKAVDNADRVAAAPTDEAPEGTHRRVIDGVECYARCLGCGEIDPCPSDCPAGIGWYPVQNASPPSEEGERGEDLRPFRCEDCETYEWLSVGWFWRVGDPTCPECDSLLVYPPEHGAPEARQGEGDERGYIGPDIPEGVLWSVAAAMDEAWHAGYEKAREDAGLRSTPQGESDG